MIMKSTTIIMHQSLQIQCRLDKHYNWLRSNLALLSPNRVLVCVHTFDRFYEAQNEMRKAIQMLFNESMNVTLKYSGRPTPDSTSVSQIAILSHSAMRNNIMKYHTTKHNIITYTTLRKNRKQYNAIWDNIM